MRLIGILDPRFFSVVLAASSLLIGCSPTAAPPGSNATRSIEEQTVLRVLIVDDDELARSIGDQWKVRAIDDEIEVRTASSKDLAETKRFSADVVVFPARWLGELAERDLIQPIPETMLAIGTAQGDGSPKIMVNDLLPTVRQCDLSWGRKLYAVTLGSPQFVLLYRPDLFEKLELRPPTTWEEYQAAAVKLADRAALGELAPAEGQLWHAALEPTADGWAGIALQARAASAIRAEGQLYALFDVDTMSARIASPPLLRATQEMAAALKTSGATERRLTPAEVRAAFFAGECGMAITWPSAAGAKESKTPIAFAELPGRSEFFSFKTSAWVKKVKDADPRTSLCAVSGRLAAVTREARRSRAAFALLAWLGGDEAAGVLGVGNEHATLFNRTQLANPGAWLGGGVSSAAAGSYSEVAQSAFGRAMWMPIVRLPGVDAYHAALDAAVVESLVNPDKAEEALTTAAKQWDDITRQHGISRQRRAYQRSLGNDY